MHLRLLSTTHTIVDSDQIVSVTLTTVDGVITVLTNHEPIIGAVVPCVLVVRFVGGQEDRYAVGGGALETAGLNTTILVDMAQDEFSLTPENIEKRHAELSAEIARYRAEHGTTDMDHLIQLEEEYLRESAKMQLINPR